MVFHDLLQARSMFSHPFLTTGRLVLWIALVSCILFPIAAIASEEDAAFANLPNTESSPTRALPPQEALASMQLPDGFRAAMFAAEPLVRQPIAMTTDARGRLWVAENYTYAEASTGFDHSLRDRIVILEDSDGDGQADRRTVFWDKADKLTSIELGLGGVWALCAPYLLFIPDADGDDHPDGEPVVMLEGFNDDQVRHNVVNGLRWGPDGWLYGRHGILRTSHVGVPGTPPEERTALNCSIWRFHPVQKRFEVVTHGTTNSWGHDWDSHGQMFFINTVIGHLWHVIPGAHYERMYGVDFNPHLYELLPQTADHFHWDTRERWLDIRKLGVTPTTDEAGGGHAHSGLMIYQGDNWPKEYRGQVFAINFHGRRINRDILRRKGASYIASHAPDLIRFGDPWFRGIDLITGADGGVFISDWSDAGECHDEDGIHRESGRIYKIAYGTQVAATPDNLAALSEEQLIQLLPHENVWYSRQVQTELYGRAVAGQSMRAAKAALLALYAAQENPVHRLRAMWCLNCIHGAEVDWLLQQLDDDNEHIRVWAIKLLSESGQLVSTKARSRVERLAQDDSSGLVLLTLASELQKLPLADRWPIARVLAGRQELADDPYYGRMLWYGIEPAAPAQPDMAVNVAISARLPLIRRHIVRRLAGNLQTDPAPLARLADRLADINDIALRGDVLQGMADALQGWRKAAAPDGWQELLQQMAESDDTRLQNLARDLLVVFGDGRAIEELQRLVLSTDAPAAQRRNAIRSLVASRTPGLAAKLQRLVEQREVAAEAIRGLAAFSDPKTPELVVRYYERLEADARTAAINTLSSRPVYASSLLAAIAAGEIPRVDIPAFQIRQMWSFGDEQIRTQLQELWPEFRHTSKEKQLKIDEYRQKLTPERLAKADLSQGRLVFDRSCAGCHRLFGNGKVIGPDLTGAQRNNLNYLLQNIVDPSAQLAENYRTSILRLIDGRIVNGVVTVKEGPVLKLQTPNELLSIPTEDVEEMVQSGLSMMPERLLDVLPEHEVQNLIAYLMSPQQTPLKVAE